MTITGSTTRAADVLKIDQWQMGDVPLPAALIAGVDLGWSVGDRQPRGLLGSDVLRRFGAVTIDYAHAQLILPRGA